MSGVKRMIVSTDNYAPLGAMKTAGKEDDQLRSRVYIYIYTGLAHEGSLHRSIEDDLDATHLR